MIQNAIEDATRFKKSGLTAILLYPMNALANDQLARIESYLDGSGFEGAVRVGKYDRSTSEAERDKLRANPPHILLTNYMMLEYLLVRPKDREDIFANHRCRFLVLDEVHTYRGTLGTNIALLVRRVQAHLALARQDWFTNVPEADRPRRFPKLIAHQARFITFSGRFDRMRRRVMQLLGKFHSPCGRTTEQADEAAFPPAGIHRHGRRDRRRSHQCVVAAVPSSSPALPASESGRTMSRADSPGTRRGGLARSRPSEAIPRSTSSRAASSSPLASTYSPRRS